MSLQFIVQTELGRYTDLFKNAIKAGEFDALDVAVAYATVGGVAVLTDVLANSLGDRWLGMNKRWLVGIDWCRSDPPALSQLTQLEMSEVRVPDGSALVKRKAGCQPSVTYHPKLFVLRGPEAIAVISGSGNLSANGMLRGCECGSLLIEASQKKTRQTSGMASDLGKPSIVAPLQGWFDRAWTRGAKYPSIARAYETICRKRAKDEVLVPTDDDSVARYANGLTAIQLQQLRTFDHLWIESGALGANLGRGKPGNQLDMKRFTRVYFGAAADDLPPETPIDDLTLIWDGAPHTHRTLKFGDNKMDKLNVPPVGQRGDRYYEGKTLLFTRVRSHVFDFKVGDEAQKESWRRLSERSGVLMPNIKTREWGLF